VADIYALIHPDTGALRYIGKANCVRTRFAGHIRDSRNRNTPLYAWIRKLAANGLEPDCVVIEENCAEWQSREKFYIASGKAAGYDLLNMAEGGGQPFCPPEVRSENGRKTLAKLRNGDYEAKRNTKEAVLIDGYSWSLKGYIRAGATEKAESIRQHMRDLYAEDPKSYKCWKNV